MTAEVDCVSIKIIIITGRVNMIEQERIIVACTAHRNGKLLAVNGKRNSIFNIGGGKTMAEKGYCVKCKASKEMEDAKEVTMKNGRKAMKGKCPDCSTGMYKILGKK